MRAAVVVAVALLIGLVARWAPWSTSSTPVDVGEVASRFTTQPSGVATSAAPGTTVGGSSTPAVATTVPPPPPVEPGVYRAVSSGQEGIDALTKPTRTYPAESALVVTSSGCGVRVEWVPLEERREWFEVCPADGGLRLVQYGSFHTFFDNDDERSLICPVDAWLVSPGAVAGSSSIVTCVGSGLVDVRTTTVTGRERIRLDGVDLEVTVVEVSVATSGDTTGTARRTMWLTESGFPAVWADTVTGASDSVVGVVNYREAFELRVMSLTPV